MATIKQVLVPTDFSHTAGLALDYAKTIAQAMKAPIHVLHVQQDPFALAWFEVYTPPQEYWDATKRDAQAALERVLTDAERQRFHAALCLVDGFPADQIVNYAKEQQIDLIVMGTHGRGPLTRMLLGSVADKVVRSAPCPVLTVHPLEHN